MGTPEITLGDSSMNTPACTECGRTLLLTNSALLCTYRYCGAYGQDVSDDNPPEITTTQQTSSDKVAQR